MYNADLLARSAASMSGTSEMYALFLKNGKSKKICTACNRPLSSHELPEFEKYVSIHFTEVQQIADCHVAHRPDEENLT